MKKWKVRVVEKHSDYVHVEANSKEEAEDKALAESHCEYECTYSSEAIEED